MACVALQLPPSVATSHSSIFPGHQHQERNAFQASHEKHCTPPPSTKRKRIYTHSIGPGSNSAWKLFASFFVRPVSCRDPLSKARSITPPSPKQSHLLQPIAARPNQSGIHPLFPLLLPAQSCYHARRTDERDVRRVLQSAESTKRSSGLDSQFRFFVSFTFLSFRCVTSPLVLHL